MPTRFSSFSSNYLTSRTRYTYPLTRRVQDKVSLGSLFAMKTAERTSPVHSIPRHPTSVTLPIEHPSRTWLVELVSGFRTTGFAERAPETDPFAFMVFSEICNGPSLAVKSAGTRLPRVRRFGFCFHRSIPAFETGLAYLFSVVVF